MSHWPHVTGSSMISANIVKFPCYRISQLRDSSWRVKNVEVAIHPSHLSLRYNLGHLNLSTVCFVVTSEYLASCHSFIIRQLTFMLCILGHGNHCSGGDLCLGGVLDLVLDWVLNNFYSEYHLSGRGGVSMGIWGSLVQKFAHKSL